MNSKEIAYCYFRNLVYCVYRKIRVFKAFNHNVLYKKAKIDSNYFDARNGLIQAEQLYSFSVNKQNIYEITQPYIEMTGLNLNDLLCIFAEGNWGYCNYGGPKWAKITEATIQLMKIIQNEDLKVLDGALTEIQNIEHNNGKVINKFHHN